MITIHINTKYNNEQYLTLLVYFNEHVVLHIPIIQQHTKIKKPALLCPRLNIE
jgi:hypothetical protein